MFSLTVKYPFFDDFPNIKENEMRVILTGYTCIKGKQYQTGEEILIKREYIYNVCSYISSVLRGEP